MTGKNSHRTPAELAAATFDARLAEISPSPLVWARNIADGISTREEAEADFRASYDRIQALKAAPQQAAPTQPAGAVERDAARYRWLRERHWDDSAICVVTEPKKTVLLGTHCPSEERLDAAIDAAMAATPQPTADGKGVV